MLEVHGLSAHHGQLGAVRSFDLSLEAGTTVAVIGANGAGKSTLMNTIAGAHRASAGTVHLDGTDITRLPAHQRVRLGICLVPEGRRLFPSLTVQDNLRTGTYSGRPGPWDLESVFDMFGWMNERRRQRAGSLSGGQQQGVAIARALLANPRVLLIDELSLGLAPSVVTQMYALLPRITERGTAVLIVEQNVAQAMRAADTVHCLLEGRQVLSGRRGELGVAEVEAAYFGIGAAR